MWSYYGSKNRISHLYPKPLHGEIIEPFAGAAYYSLRYFENDITLIDKSPLVISIWHYLQEASINDIRGLPILKVGDRIKREHFDCDGQFDLMRFLIVQGAHHGSTKVTKWGALRLQSNINRVIKNIHKIKHWTIKLGDYTDVEIKKATYFIDPPYFVGGDRYQFPNKKIDYLKLSEWVQQLDGQVIVCENTRANWLPFIPFKSIRGVQHQTTEAIWTNYHTHFNNIQQKLFT